MCCQGIFPVTRGSLVKCLTLCFHACPIKAYVSSTKNTKWLWRIYNKMRLNPWASPSFQRSPTLTQLVFVSMSMSIISIIIYSGIFYQILLIGVTSRNKEEHCNWAIVSSFLHRLKSPQYLQSFCIQFLSPKCSESPCLSWGRRLKWHKLCVFEQNRLKYSKWSELQAQRNNGPCPTVGCMLVVLKESVHSARSDSFTGLTRYFSSLVYNEDLLISSAFFPLYFSENVIKLNSKCQLGKL